LASSSEAPHTAALHRLGKHLLPARTQRCLEPRSLSSRREPSRLHSALRRLRAALQRLPPQPREEGIRALSPEVRWQLLKFMEASATSASPKIGPKPTKRTKSSEPKTCGLQQNRQGLFRAKISFEHIRLYSSYTLPRAAVEYHILLVRLRQLVMMNTPQAASASEGVSELCEAFATAFAELEREPVVNMRPRDCLSGEQGLNCFLKKYGIRSYLSIHVARWLGSRHVSSPVLPLGDVLTLRQQLLLARSKGLEPFRDAWLKMLQRLGHSASGSGSSGHSHFAADTFKDQVLQMNPCVCKKRRRAAEALHEAMGRQRSAGLRKQAVSRKRQDAVARLRAASCATERALAACNVKRHSSSRNVRKT
ncbi:unnamed protein product, partial [Symbiodinium necroappetens]